MFLSSYTNTSGIRLIASPNKIRFLKGVLNILDLLSILPFYVTLTVPEESAGSIDILRVMRVIRVCRIFKLTRHSKGLHVLGKTLYASVNELIMLMLFLVIGVVLFASAAYYAEEDTNPQFSSIPAAFWWAVVTMTTVGYGDVSPKTTPGKSYFLKLGLLMKFPSTLFPSNSCFERPKPFCIKIMESSMVLENLVWAPLFLLNSKKARILNNM